jgi:serine/threonine protein kinase
MWSRAGTDHQNSCMFAFFNLENSALHIPLVVHFLVFSVIYFLFWYVFFLAKRNPCSCYLFCFGGFRLCPDGLYNNSVDIWSCGCILAEMLGRAPLFPGKTFIHQLSLVFDVIGTPQEKDVQHIINSEARDFLKSQRNKRKLPFSTIYPKAESHACQLLDALLVFNPVNRISVDGALQSPYLSGVGSNSSLNFPPTSPEFEFSFENNPAITRYQLKHLILDEISSFRVERYGYGPYGEAASGNLLKPVLKRKTNGTAERRSKTIEESVTAYQSGRRFSVDAETATGTARKDNGNDEQVATVAAGLLQPEKSYMRSTKSFKERAASVNKVRANSATVAPNTNRQDYHNDCKASDADDNSTSGVISERSRSTTRNTARIPKPASAATSRVPKTNNDLPNKNEGGEFSDLSPSKPAAHIASTTAKLLANLDREFAAQRRSGANIQEPPILPPEAKKKPASSVDMASGVTDFADSMDATMKNLLQLCEQLDNTLPSKSRFETDLPPSATAGKAGKSQSLHNSGVQANCDCDGGVGMERHDLPAPPTSTSPDCRSAAQVRRLAESSGAENLQTGIYAGLNADSKDLLNVTRGSYDYKLWSSPVYLSQSLHLSRGGGGSGGGGDSSSEAGAKHVGDETDVEFKSESGDRCFPSVKGSRTRVGIAGMDFEVAPEKPMGRASQSQVGAIALNLLDPTSYAQQKEEDVRASLSLMQKQKQSFVARPYNNDAKLHDAELSVSKPVNEKTAVRNNSFCPSNNSDGSDESGSLTPKARLIPPQRTLVETYTSPKRIPSWGQQADFLHSLVEGSATSADVAIADRRGATECSSSVTGEEDPEVLDTAQSLAHARARAAPASPGGCRTARASTCRGPLAQVSSPPRSPSLAEKLAARASKLSANYGEQQQSNTSTISPEITGREATPVLQTQDPVGRTNRRDSNKKSEPSVEDGWNDAAAAAVTNAHASIHHASLSKRHASAGRAAPALHTQPPPHVIPPPPNKQKFTVAKSPKFSQMSWQRRASNGIISSANPTINHTSNHPPLDPFDEGMPMPGRAASRKKGRVVSAAADGVDSAAGETDKEQHSVRGNLFGYIPPPPRHPSSQRLRK